MNVSLWFLKCFDLPPNMLFAASAKHTKGKLADAEQWQSPPRSWLTSTYGITCLPTSLTLCTELMQVPASTPSDHYKIKVVKHINYFTYIMLNYYYIVEYMLNVCRVLYSWTKKSKYYATQLGKCTLCMRSFNVFNLTYVENLNCSKLINLFDIYKISLFWQVKFKV